MIDLDVDDFLHVLGLLLSMENYDIHDHTLFSSMRFGEIMSVKRFENILKYLKLSENENEEQ